jgi:predicted nucleic acid-binding protein
MNVLVDTSVWSLAMRRDAPPVSGELDCLRRLLEGGDAIFTTGLILQELLQGFRGPKARQKIIDRFVALPLIVPDRRDHVDAAGLQIKLREKGVQAGTIDVLLAQLCLRYKLSMLASDSDFRTSPNMCRFHSYDGAPLQLGFRSSGL